MMRFVAALILFVSLCETASATPPYRYRTGYGYGYTPSYGNTYYYSAPTYSDWRYWVYPGTPYFYRVRTVYNGYSNAVEDDGNLYVKTHDGGYALYSTIASYLYKPNVVLTPASRLAVLGTADYILDPVKYAVARTYDPVVASVLLQQPVPTPTDVAALLPPATTDGPARLEAALKTSSSATESLKQIAIGEQEKEKLVNAGRQKLAELTIKGQLLERLLGKANETFAITDQTSLNGAVNPASVPVNDPLLAQLISTVCFNCHGGAKTEGGVDFRQADSWGAAEWKTVRNSVFSGKMPKGGQPLSDDQKKLFDDYHDRVLLSKK